MFYKKRIEAMEEKIAALEKEQLSINKTFLEFMKTETRLVEIVKELRNDLCCIESQDANISE